METQRWRERLQDNRKHTYNKWKANHIKKISEKNIADMDNLIRAIR